MLRNEPVTSGTGTPLTTSTRPPISRNASTNTTVLRDMTGGTASPRPGKAPTARAADQRKRLSSLPITSKTNKSPDPDPAPEPSSARSSSPGAESDSSDSSSSSPGQSRIIRRPPRYQQDAGASYEDDEDDESEPAFQPYKPSSAQTSAQDLGSTLRGDAGRSSSKRFTRKLGKPMHRSQTSDSSASSAAMVQRPTKSRDQRTPGPLSPRRVTELDGNKSRGSPREGSDGTPSMGSSFSDLDGKIGPLQNLRHLVDAF